MDISIPVKCLKGNKFRYSAYANDDQIVIVTHGSKNGKLEGPNGQLFTSEAFCDKLLKAYKDREILVLACHADRRPKECKGVNLNPLNSTGKIKQQFFLYFDGEEGEGDLLVSYK